MAPKGSKTGLQDSIKLNLFGAFEFQLHENSPIAQKIHETTARANLEGPCSSPVSIILKITMVSKGSIETWMVHWRSWNYALKLKIHETTERAYFPRDT